VWEASINGITKEKDCFRPPFHWKPWGGVRFG